MQARVTAILVAHNGSEYVDRTLAALARQVRKPDSLAVVDAASTDESAQQLATSGASVVVSVRGKASFGEAVANAVAALPATESSDEWLWLLGHDNAPEPRALAELLGAVEIAPSVAVAGPKLMRWDLPDTISSYGTSVTQFGATVDLVVDELDQAQHDRRSDTLAVGAPGMLVRRGVWEAVGGFDPALPHVDSALDLCIRVRLAGHRIVGVPSARVASAGPPEEFGKKPLHSGARARLAREAQLHRRLTYASRAALPWHWLSLVPLAFVRAVAQLLAKNPAAVFGEFAAAFRVAFGPGVAPARRNLRRGRTLGWAAIAPLRMPRRETRELRAARREVRAFSDNPGPQRERASFLSGGGGWITLALFAIGLLVFSGLIGASSVAGGSLLPLSATIAEVWSNVAFGWREVGGGFVGAADPFVWVLASLASFTFWSPSTSIVVLYFLALPLAGLGAWWAATRLSERAWPPAVAAILWAFAPPFLASLTEGRLGAAIAHIVLPWLALGLLGAARSWTAAAASALLFAVAAASAPVLIPVLVLCWLAWMLRHPRGAYRTMIVPIPAVVLFAPLVVQQIAAGNPLGLLADPGVARPFAVPSGWQLAIASPAGEANGWSAVASALGLPSLAGPIIVAALLAPLAALAILALFLRGSGRAITSLIVALLGFVTAVASTHLAVAFDGSTPVFVWAGAGLSVYWLGISGAAVVSLEALGKAVLAPAMLVIVTIGALAWPLAASPITGGAEVRQGTGRLLPALATADARADPDIATLELIAQPDGSLAARVHRGAGTTLDELSTLVSTGGSDAEARERVAVLAGNLASRSAFDSSAELDDLGIRFVVAPPTEGDRAERVRERVVQALRSNPEFTSINEATEFGFLWKFEGAGEVDLAHPRGGALATAIVAAQGTLLVAIALLAVPSRSRRRTAVVAHDPDDELTAEFDEDTDE